MFLCYSSNLWLYWNCFGPKCTNNQVTSHSLQNVSYGNSAFSQLLIDVVYVIVVVDEDDVDDGCNDDDDDDDADDDADDDDDDDIDVDVDEVDDDDVVVCVRQAEAWIKRRLQELQGGPAGQCCPLQGSEEASTTLHRDLKVFENTLTQLNQVTMEAAQQQTTVSLSSRGLSF